MKPGLARFFYAHWKQERGAGISDYQKSCKKSALQGLDFGIPET
jgi:hypothetical protein